jgi:hypothetical protein
MGASGHKAYDLLTKSLFWKPTVWESRLGHAVQAREHYDALQLVKPDIPGLMPLDGDAGLKCRNTDHWHRLAAHPMEKYESKVSGPSSCIKTFCPKSSWERRGSTILADLDTFSPISPPFIENIVRSILISIKPVSTLSSGFEAAGLSFHNKHNEIAAVMLWMKFIQRFVKI